MDSLIVPVVIVVIEPHPNADVLELAKVGEYRAVVRKGEFTTGDRCAYIPQGAILPEGLLREMGLWDDATGKGKLGGGDGTRLKAVRLRGQLSEGLVYPAKPEWEVGQDVSDELGLIKYTPPIPVELSGQVEAVCPGVVVRYDIKHWKAYPNVLAEGEEVVVITEKIHGTQIQIGNLATLKYRPGEFVTSKGLGKSGVGYSYSDDNKARNVYVRAEIQHRVQEKVYNWRVKKSFFDDSILLFGEVFGKGVQDLHYGTHLGGDALLGLRIYDIWIGTPQEGRFLDSDDLDTMLNELGLPRVPVLYRGPYSKRVLLDLLDGAETVSGHGAHMREGLVIRPAKERVDSRIGRVQFKVISEAYLLRGNATEYN